MSQVQPQLKQTDVEYFKSCFDEKAEPGVDDMDLAYAYLHASDTKKFVSGFKKYLEQNVIVVFAQNENGGTVEMEAIYSVHNFLQWVNVEMDEQDKKILEPTTWEEYRISRFMELEEEALKGRIEPIS